MNLQGHSRLPAGPVLAALLVLGFLALFLAVPVGTVFYSAFVNADGGFTIGHFGAFFNQPLMLEAFFNSLYVAGWSALLASLIAVPLAYFTVRFDFRGALIIQTLGVLPLIMPPFVGAVAMQLIFGRSGSVNLLLNDWFGFTIPFMEGLNGVIFVEALHYFPFILMNLVVALRNIDGAMEEAAFNLGARGFRLFRRVIFPLALPGYVAGASLVFVKVFDDLGTPLVLGTTNMLAPRISAHHAGGAGRSAGLCHQRHHDRFLDPGAVAVGARAQGPRLFHLAKGGNSIQKRKLRPAESVLAYGWIVLVLLLVLSPHMGVLLLSLASVWSFAPLPDGYTLAHYGAVFSESQGMIANTLLYCGGGGRGCDPGHRHRLPDAAHPAAGAPVAGLPGLGGAGDSGHRAGDRAAAHLPRRGDPGHRHAADLVVDHHHDRVLGAAAAVRLAFVRGRAAADQRIAGGSGAIARRDPDAHHPARGGAIDGRGMLAGFVTSFVTAAVELSATIMLVTKDSQAPMSYGIYLYMQSAAGRGPGAALGVLAVAAVAVGTYVSHLLVERAQARQRPARHDETA